MRVFIALFLSLSTLGIPGRAAVETHTLANGLRILVEEDHDIPNVALYLFYRVGSRNEEPGRTGISHFFEHMMFNGAEKYGPKQFDVVMEKNGGRNNAYTSRDLTVYTDWFPSNALELMFDMESDRMRSLRFDPKMIESERGVVLSERKQSVENSNAGLLYEQLGATAFAAHPYQWPVVGWESDIKAWTMEDLKRHFKMGYAPNNCLMVVVGAVTGKQAFALAEKYFKDIPRQEPPEAIRTVEPPQAGERRVVVEKEAQLPLLMISYHVPSSTHRDNWALQVFASVLSQGESSRLYRRLVDGDQLALAAELSPDLSLDPGQSVFYAQPRAGVEPSRVEAAFEQELDRLRKSPVSDEELRKAKNQLLTSLYREMKTIAGRANLLGQYEIYYGDHKRLYTAAQDLEAVTAQDVMRVAAQYYSKKNRTVATLIPETKQ